MVNLGISRVEPSVAAKHTGLEEYAACQSRAFLKGTVTFAAGASGLFVVQRMLSKKFAFPLRWSILLSAVAGSLSWCKGNERWWWECCVSMSCFKEYSSGDRAVELNNKLYLTEKYKNAYFQTSEKAIAQNAEKLHQIRKDVLQEHIDFKKAGRVVQDFITLECQDRKKLKACLARTSVEDTKDLLNRHVYSSVNNYNMSCYEVKKREKTLKDLIQTLKSVQKESRPDVIESNNLTLIRQIENKIEKMDTKIQVAERINYMYQNILDCLQEESVHIPQRISDFDGIVEGHKQELEALAQVSKNAAEARKNMWIELEVLEKSYVVEKKKRETILINKRKILNLERYAMKHIDVSSLRTTTGHSGNSSPKSPKSSSQDQVSKPKNNHQVYIFQEINKAMEQLNCSKIEDIEKRIRAQNSTSEYLKWKIMQQKRKRKELNVVFDKLLLRHAELKFDSDANTTSLLQMKKEGMDQVQIKKEKLDLEISRMVLSREFLLTIQNGIDNLFFILYGINLNVEEPVIIPQDTEEKLRICEKKLLHLIELTMEFKHTGWSESDYDKLIDFLENSFGQHPRNKNVIFESEVTEYQEELDFMGTQNEGVITREDIKRRSERLVQEKTRVVRRTKKMGRKRYIGKHKVTCNF